MDTFALLTLQLAKAFGIVMIAVALGALTRPHRFGEAVADFERSPGLALLGAILGLFIGLGLIMTHNLWTDLTAILVSIIGWAALAKTALLLAAPKGFLSLAAAATSSPGRVRVWGVVMLVVGAVYLALGVLGRASVSL